MTRLLRIALAAGLLSFIGVREIWDDMFDNSSWVDVSTLDQPACLKTEKCAWVCVRAKCFLSTDEPKPLDPDFFYIPSK